MNTQIHGPWQVTYFNPATGQRHTLIDAIDEATANRVVETFGDNGEAFNRLPEVRKERTPGAAVTK